MVRMPSAIQSTPPSGKDKAWTQGTPSGTRIKPRTVTGRIKNVYPQRGPFVNNPSPTSKKEKPSTVRLPSAVKSVKRPSGRDKAWTRGTISGGGLTPRSVSRKVKTFFPQSGPFVNNPSLVAKVPGSNPRNKPLSESRRLSASKAAAQGRSLGIKGAGFKTITSQFITRGRKNVYWGKFSKKEKAVTTDIAGRKLRTRNYHSPKAGLVGRDTLPFFRRVPRQIKRGPAQITGGYQSATRTGKSWSGDISGKKTRKAVARPNKEQVGSFFWPRKFSLSAKGERTGRPIRKGPEFEKRKPQVSAQPIPGKVAGAGGSAFIKFSKSASPRKRSNWLGGSASGKSWNNQNKPVAVRPGGVGAYRAGTFQGNAKTRRPETGGGSVSGRLWNNNNRSVSVRTIGAGTLRAGTFQGRTKTRGPLKGGGSVSGKLWNNRNQPVEVKKAGIGTISAARFKGRTKGIVGGDEFNRIGLNFSGSKKARRPVTGGGSVSGRLWNNKNQPVAVRRGGVGAFRAGTFQGNAKTRRPEKGGGSVSGILWNNKNKPVAVRPGGVGSFQAGTFQGNVKTKQPEKGGGSISGKLWNNKNQPVAVRRGGVGAFQAGTFQGNVKTKKPEKGGGSISGILWNNKNKPVAVRQGGVGAFQAGTFQGNVKIKQPEKGGGSISGKLWNNRNQPIQVRLGGTGSRLAGTFQGNTKIKQPEKGGGSISGILWNNRSKPILVKTGGIGTANAGVFKGKTKYNKPEQTAGKPAVYQGKIKGHVAGGEFNRIGLNFNGEYKRKKNGIDNKEAGLLSKLFKKDKTGMLPATHISRDERVASYSKRGQRSIISRYVQNPKAADASLKKDRQPDGIRLNLPIVNQTKRSVNAGHYVHTMKQYWDYKRNPNSSKEAMKLREPGRAEAKIGNLQVNVKMRKYSDRSLHPDAKFAHGFRDNVKEERSMLMNVRLVWAKLFKKSENQPRGLKQKPGKPRYDPKEKDLWYD